jgi:predicted Fe-S protein YdhL (DUF1289 family)
MALPDFIERAAPQAIVSPCILVCTLDPATGWCLGCGRTGDEIACWTAMTDAGRDAVMQALPERMVRLNR